MVMRRDLTWIRRGLAWKMIPISSRAKQILTRPRVACFERVFVVSEDNLSTGELAHLGNVCG
jgi:hypothetical protein